MSNIGRGDATKNDRRNLLFLIDRKLTGARREEAVRFALRSRGRGPLGNLEQRLLSLPDLPEQRNTLLSPEQVLLMVERREQGATFQQLAEQFSCALETARRAVRKWEEQERLAEQSEQREPDGAEQ